MLIQLKLCMPVPKILGNHPTCGEPLGPAAFNATSAFNVPLRLPLVDPRVKPNLN